MTIKEIRKITGLTQKDFAKKYKIPLSTIKGWESSPNKKRYRECPSYVLKLLKRAVKEDYVLHKVKKTKLCQFLLLVCPSCHNTLASNIPPHVLKPKNINYCPRCGKKLDWSDING